jgi:aspartate racemase
MDPKTIGIVAITAEGGSLCYRTIVAESAALLPAQVHPPIAMYTPSFHITNGYIQARDWQGLGPVVQDAIAKVVSIGAQLVVIPANAPHYGADYFVPECPVPFVSIVDTTVAACVDGGYKRVAILGIGITMSDGLYEQPLRDRGIEPMTPTAEEQAVINRVIFDHIIPARVTPDSTLEIVDVMASLKQRGADAIILGCTELPIVINEDNAPLPFIDTTRLLARKALEFSCSEMVKYSPPVLPNAHW